MRRGGSPHPFRIHSASNTDPFRSRHPRRVDPQPTLTHCGVAGWRHMLAIHMMPINPPMQPQTIPAMAIPRPPPASPPLATWL